MSRVQRIGASVLLVLLVAGYCLWPSPAKAYTGCGGVYDVAQHDPAIADQLTTLINTKRQQQGHDALVRVAILDVSSSYYAEDMVRDRYPTKTDHVTRDRDENDQLQDVCERDQRVRTYTGALYWEVMAYGYSTPQQVLDSWMRSNNHGPYLMSEDYNALGVGYNIGEDGIPVWVGIVANVDLSQTPEPTSTPTATASPPPGSTPTAIAEPTNVPDPTVTVTHTPQPVVPPCPSGSRCTYVPLIIRQ